MSEQITLKGIIYTHLYGTKWCYEGKEYFWEIVQLVDGVMKPFPMIPRIGRPVEECMSEIERDYRRKISKGVKEAHKRRKMKNDSVSMQSNGM